MVRRGMGLSYNIRKRKAFKFITVKICDTECFFIDSKFLETIKRIALTIVFSMHQIQPV